MIRGEDRSDTSSSGIGPEALLGRGGWICVLAAYGSAFGYIPMECKHDHAEPGFLDGARSRCPYSLGRR
jgi:hypothetical protein